MPFRFFLSLLLVLQLVLVPLAQSRPALAATGHLASFAAGGDEEDSAHNELAALQEKGAGYTKEIAALKGTGEFEHTTEDSLEDALRRNRRLTETTRGGVEIGSGTVAVVGGAKLTVASAAACGPTAGLSCLAIPFAAATTAGGAMGVYEGGQRLRSVFNGSDAYTDEGQRVLDSFSPSTHRGDESLVREVGIDTAKNIATAAAGGAALKYNGKLALNKLGNAKDYLASFFKTSDVSAPKGGLGANPFKGKTPEQIDKMFKAKNFEIRGSDPISGKGGYVNPKTRRSYHIDPEAQKWKAGTEYPHVDVNRLKGSDLPKRKYPLGDKLTENE